MVLIKSNHAEEPSRLEIRFRELLCDKICEKDKVVVTDFCKLPGYRIARTEKNGWIKKINENNKEFDKKYNADVHLVDSCVRHLMRKKDETVLGKTDFVLSSYSGPKGQVSRFGIPLDDDLLLYFMVENPDKITHIPPIMDNLHEIVGKFKKFKEEKQKDFDALESKQKIYLSDFNQEIEKSIFSELFKIGDNAETSTNENYTEKKKKPPIRWAAWALNSGRYHHYCSHPARRNDMILTTTVDLNEHIASALTRNIMRCNLQPFFGHLDYTLTVFERLARMTVRLDDKNTLFVSLDKEEIKEHEENGVFKREITKRVYTPKIITDVHEFFDNVFEWRTLDTISLTELT